MLMNLKGGEENKVNSLNYFRLYQRIQHCQQVANFEEPTIEFAWGRISLGQLQVYTLNCNNVVLEKARKIKQGKSQIGINQAN